MTYLAKLNLDCVTTEHTSRKRAPSLSTAYYSTTVLCTDPAQELKKKFLINVVSHRVPLRSKEWSTRPRGPPVTGREAGQIFGREEDYVNSGSLSAELRTASGIVPRRGRLAGSVRRR